MKKLFSIFFAFLIITLIIILGAKIFLNNLGLQGIAKSNSIKESKKIGAFIAKYNIVNIENTILDSLDKYKMLYLFKDSTEFWIEKSWHRFPKFIFFHPIQFENRKSLLFQNIFQRQSSIFNSVELGLVFKGQPIETYDKAQLISQIFIDSIPKIIILDAYWVKVTNYAKDQYLGRIILNRTE